MIDAMSIVPGAVVYHPERDHEYLIVSVGHVKWEDGVWYPCASYMELGVEYGPVYFRRCRDFNNFELRERK